MGTRLINYGFEDYTGDIDTTPGYIFSTDTLAYWDGPGPSTTDYHKFPTAVVSNCSGDTAHTGTYFFSVNYCAEFTDPCNGKVGVVQNRSNIGFNGIYPTDSGDSTDLETDVTTNVLTVRFWFRLRGNWRTNTNQSAGNLFYHKFIRVYGADLSANAHLHIRPRDDYVDNTVFYLYDPATSDFGDQLLTGVKLDDGEWHNVVFKVTRNNDTGAEGNITQTVWWDDWDMEGSPQGERTTTSAGFGANFRFIKPFGNFGADQPQELIGADMDSIEVWDGVPTAAGDNETSFGTGSTGFGSGTTSFT